MKKHIDNKLVFLCSGLIFAYILRFVPNDIDEHLKHVRNINEGLTNYPPNFLFYYLVNLLSGFSSHKIVMNIIAVIVLSASVMFKFIITKKIISHFIKKEQCNITNKNIKIASICLLFFFAIPDFYGILILKKFYLAHIVPVVWHNSTTILLMPFAILLFWKQLELLYKANYLKRDLIIITFIAVINIIIKPSFIFVYLPVTFVIIMLQFQKTDFKKLLLTLLPLIISGLVLLIQYVLIYEFQQGSMQKNESSIDLSKPFEVMRNWVPLWYIPISFFFSLALPIFSIYYFRDILNFKPFRYALQLTAFGILVSAFLIETGPRETHGNFLWQNVICCYLLMLTTIVYLLPKFLDKTLKSKKIVVLKIIFSLHVISGVLYLAELAVMRKYF